MSLPLETRPNQERLHTLGRQRTDRGHRETLTITPSSLSLSGVIRTVGINRGKGPTVGDNKIIQRLVDSDKYFISDGNCVVRSSVDDVVPCVSRQPTFVSSTVDFYCHGVISTLQ